jgi:predicted HicB family RNase H-like nuclease
MKYDLFDYSIIHFREEDDPDYGVFIEEIPQVSAYGDTPEDALKELRIAFEGWSKTIEEKGWDIPDPFKYRKYSGTFNVRIPKSMHKELAEQAERDNTSLNQELIFCLTTGLERRRKKSA